jgi:hypothetical protein
MGLSQSIGCNDEISASRMRNVYKTMGKMNEEFHDLMDYKTNTQFIISRSFLHRMRSVSDKYCTENKKTRFMISNFFFENHAVYEIM